MKQKLRKSSKQQTEQKAPPSGDEYLKRREVGKLLKVCEHTIQRATKSGKLRAIVFNRRLVRYRRSDVEAYVAQSQTQQEAA